MSTKENSNIETTMIDQKDNMSDTEMTCQQMPLPAQSSGSTVQPNLSHHPATSDDLAAPTSSNQQQPSGHSNSGRSSPIPQPSATSVESNMPQQTQINTMLIN